MIFLRSTFTPSPHLLSRSFSSNIHNLQPGLILFKEGLSPKEQFHNIKVVTRNKGFNKRNIYSLMEVVLGGAFVGLTAFSKDKISEQEVTMNLNTSSLSFNTDKLEDPFLHAKVLSLNVIMKVLQTIDIVLPQSGS